MRPASPTQYELPPAPASLGFCKAGKYAENPLAAQDRALTWPYFTPMASDQWTDKASLPYTILVASRPISQAQWKP